VDVEGHGREERLAGDADLSRTVGWFTSVVPVRLDPGETDLADALHGRPRTGRGPGPHPPPTSPRCPRPASDTVCCGTSTPRPHRASPNSTSRRSSSTTWAAFDRPEAADWSYAVEDDAADLDADPGQPMSHALTLNALTEDRSEGPELSAHWAYAAELLTEEQVRDPGPQLVPGAGGGRTAGGRLERVLNRSRTSPDRTALTHQIASERQGTPDMSNPFENPRRCLLRPRQRRGPVQPLARLRGRAGRLDGRARTRRPSGVLDHIETNWTDMRPKSLVDGG